MIDPHPAPPPLDPDACEEVLHRIAHGASIQITALKMGITTAAIRHAAENDPEFSRRLRHARYGHSDNVLAALYRKAVGGDLPSMNLFLKYAPPEDAGLENPDDREADDINRLSRGELIELLEELEEADPDPPTDREGEAQT